jgi:hypothetical protein
MNAITRAITANPTIKPNRIHAALKPRRHIEADEQAKVVEWAHWAYRHHSDKYPLLRLLHCSLNGVKLSIKQAVMAKRQGMLSGVPDLFLPVPRKCYNGLFIEMKAEKGVVSVAQDRFLREVSDLGYLAKVCYGAKEAIELIEDYYREV